VSYRISVVIPTYNRAHLLGRALDSVLSQTLPPLEIIVVDDGSSDGTEALLKHSYPQVDYLCQEHQGVSRARNHGVAESRGEWIAFLDSDDQWLPGKLEKQTEALDRQPHFQLCHTEEIWIRRGRRVNPMRKHAKSGGWIFEKCLPLCVISPSSVLIDRTLFESAGGFDEDLPACEDYDLWLRVCARNPVLFLDDALIRKYGGHHDQLSRQHWGMDRFRVRALEKLLASGIPTEVQYQAALQTLLQKCEILVQGAHKRGRFERADHYRRLILHYQSLSLELEGA